MNTTPSLFPLGECSYSDLKDFDWKDISCNLTQWDVSIQWNPFAYCIIAALHALALWFALELIVRAIFLFKRRTILYFWSLVSVAVGVILITIAFELRIFVIPANYWAFSVLYTLAQILLKTGFALVLYSRLNILQPKRRLLQAIVAMIAVTAVIGHIPFLIRTIATLIDHHDLVNQIHDIAEYFELLFAAQEIFISSCYVCYFWHYMHDAPPATQENMGRDIKFTFTGLIAAYVWVFLSDFTLYVLLYNDYYLARMMVLPLSQAIKLSLEFVVLNYLVEFRKKKSRNLRRLNVVNSSLVPETSQSSRIRSTDLEGRSVGRASDDVTLWLEKIRKAPRRESWRERIRRKAQDFWYRT